MSNSNFENVQGQRNFKSNNSERSNSRARYGGNRDGGGFRIRLSDNEMKAVKTIQETFQIKSTVAVLGFSLRTLSEMINDENLKNTITKYALNNKNNTVNNSNNNKNKEQNNKPDPFARPEKSNPIESNKTINDNNIDEK